MTRLQIVCGFYFNSDHERIIARLYRNTHELIRPEDTILPGTIAERNNKD
ncbi:hypothetical protein [Methanospirillum lacunae]|nr:hypothetical protein [Methanospirillum lacunae]